MKQLIKKLPFIGDMALSLKRKFFPNAGFTTSEEYWINRYEQNGNSGAGSYNKLAEFKAEVLNSFVATNNINTVLELGCGDGNQLKYFKFPSYRGFDVSGLIVEKCKAEFKNDPSKQFFHVNQVSTHKGELSLSLDVIYHLIEDDTYQTYMNRLFDSSTLYVIIYACDSDNALNYAPHVKPRKFTDWIRKNQQKFQLIEYIPNKFPAEEGKGSTTSFSDFFIYKRVK